MSHQHFAQKTAKRKLESGNKDDEAKKSEKKSKQEVKHKPILVMLPGASGKIATGGKGGIGMKPFLETKLGKSFDLRIADDLNWNTNNASDEKNFAQVRKFCPTEEEGRNAGDEPTWYIAAASFGNRVMCEMLAKGAYPIPPTSIICFGYPLHGEKDGASNEKRKESLQNLPSSTKVLFVSGDKDEYLHRDFLKTKGRQALIDVIATLSCKIGCVSKFVEGAKHGTVDVGKKQQDKVWNCVKGWVEDFCLGSVNE